MTKSPDTQNKAPLRPFPEAHPDGLEKEAVLRHLLRRAREFYPEGLLEFPGSLMDSLTETKELYRLEFFINGTRHLVFKEKKRK